jgi:hypothetical protein
LLVVRSCAPKTCNAAITVTKISKQVREVDPQNWTAQ